MQEVWRDVVGYEGLYKVSNLGNVYSCKRKKCLSPNIPKSCVNVTYHSIVTLRKDGKQKCFGVHRLVAMAFIPNPDNLPIVNHKDGNKQNNAVDNLEWCTQRYNVEHYFSTVGRLRKPICDKDG